MTQTINFTFEIIADNNNIHRHNRRELFVNQNEPLSNKYLLFMETIDGSVMMVYSFNFKNGGTFRTLYFGKMEILTSNNDKILEIFNCDKAHVQNLSKCINSKFHPKNNKICFNLDFEKIGNVNIKIYYVPVKIIDNYLGELQAQFTITISKNSSKFNYGFNVINNNWFVTDQT